MAEYVVYRTSDGVKHAEPFVNKAQAKNILDRADVTAGAAPVTAKTPERAIEKAFGKDVCIELLDAVRADLMNRFTYHAPKPGLNQSVRYEDIREKGREMAFMLAEECPAGRELSISMGKIEEAVLWANAAIERKE